MLLSDAVSGYLLFKSTRAAPTTIKTDRTLLRQFRRYVGECDVTSIESGDIRDYLAHHRERGLSPHTLRRHLAVIRAMYGWLCSEDLGIAQVNPADAVAAPKLPKLKPKALDRDEVVGLVASARESQNPRRDRAVVLFLLDSGCRASELCGVDVADVGFETGRVLVSGKGSKQRYVYLGKRAVSALWIYVKDERPEPAEVGCKRLFLTFDGYPMTRHTLRNLITRLAETADIHASPHMLRHTSAIEHLRNGMGIVSLQHLLGHNDISTTRGYLDALRDDDVQQTAQRTSPSDNERL